MNTGTYWHGMAIETDVIIIGAGPCGLFQLFEPELLDTIISPVMPQRLGVNAPYQDEFEAT